MIDITNYFNSHTLNGELHLNMMFWVAEYYFLIS